MTREVLPARRPFSFRALLLTGLLSACAAHVAASYTPSPPRSVQGVAPSVWRISVGHEDTACDHESVRPALLCRADFAPSFDGCRWGCLAGGVEQ